MSVANYYNTKIKISRIPSFHSVHHNHYRFLIASICLLGRSYAKQHLTEGRH